LRIEPVDLVLLALYAGAIVAFGVAIGRRQRGATDYMLGGRDLPAWAVLLSIVATETSTVSFLSVPGHASGGDLRFLQLPLGYLIGRLLVVRLLLPRYFAGQSFTAYELLQQRFGPGLRSLASSVFLVTRTLADGLRLYLTALVVGEATGLDLRVAVAATGGATILYTFVGGIRAVIWTDVAQFFVYIAGALVAFGVLVSRLDGGFESLAATPLRLVDPRPALDDPFTLPAGILGGAFLSFATHGADQMMVQRYLCARSQRSASWALGLSGVVVLAQFALFLWIGVGLGCWYRQHPPEPAAIDRRFLTFLIDEMPPGMLGIVLGAIFSVAMSTLSSSLHSCATSLVQDLWVAQLDPTASDRRRLRLARAGTVLFGLLQILVALSGPALGGSVVEHVLAIASYATGLVLGVFFLGLLPWRIAPAAALAGFAGGLAVVLALRFGTKLAWPWFAAVGSLATLLLGMIANLRRA
jgi:SSS family transporter